MRYTNLFCSNLKCSIALWVLAFSAGGALRLPAQCSVYFSYCPERVTVVDCDHSGSEALEWPMPIAATLGGCSNFSMVQTGGPLPGTVVSAPGTYSITYTAFASDVSSERKVSASCTFDVQVLADNVPPVFDNCPPNITIYTGSALTANATWVEPTVSDNCGRVKQTRPNIPCNSALGPGVHWVTYSAVDPSGNYVFCSFSITVIPGFMKPGEEPTKGGSNIPDRNDTASSLLNRNVLLLPNPFYDRLSLNTEHARDADVRVELYNMQGHLILTHPWPAQTNQTVLNTSSLTPGVYLVKIVNFDGTFQNVVRGVKL